MNIPGEPTPDAPSVTRRTVLLGAGAVTAAAAVAACSSGTDTPAEAAPERRPGDNPLVRQRADPHVQRHTDGTYYFTGSVPEYDRIVLRSALTVEGLATAEERTLWTRPTGELGGYIWAPEIHLVDGTWCIYFAAGTTDDPFRIRPYVLAADGPDPMTASWEVLGRIETAWESFSLDATTFVHEGTRYLVWAQNEQSVGPGTNLYISAMSGPATLTGPQARIAVPARPWERIGFLVNEGPAVIVRNGRVFCSFSASATDANYATGLLTADAGADLLDPSSWTKAPEPVLASDPATSVYGPGHNCFTVAEDGVTDLVVFHARDYEEIDGDPLFDPNRHARVQRLYWDADGVPAFGVPAANGPRPVRLRVGDGYLGHDGDAVLVDAAVPVARSLFQLVPGDGDTVTLRAADAPDSALAEQDGAVRLVAGGGVDAFRRVEVEGGVQFESVTAPDRSLAVESGRLVLGDTPAVFGLE